MTPIEFIHEMNRLCGLIPLDHFRIEWKQEYEDEKFIEGTAYKKTLKIFSENVEHKREFSILFMGHPSPEGLFLHRDDYELCELYYTAGEDNDDVACEIVTSPRGALGVLYFPGPR